MTTPLSVLLSVLWISSYNFTEVTGSQDVIDIFTNYPNTHEALQDYERLLESRTLEEHKDKTVKESREEPPDSSDFLTKMVKPEVEPIPSVVLEDKKNTSGDILSFLPKTITARGSSPVQFEGKMPRRRVGTRKPHGPRRYKVYKYKSGSMLNNEDPWSTFSDYSFNNDHSQVGIGGDALESEFGTFESPGGTTGSGILGYPHQNFQGGSHGDSSYSGSSHIDSTYLGSSDSLGSSQSLGSVYGGTYQGTTPFSDDISIHDTFGSYGGSHDSYGSYLGSPGSSYDLQPQATNHAYQPHATHSLLDLNSLIEVMSTRPSFLTGSLTGNRRNKTMVFTTQSTQDFIDFNVAEDDLESDFGEIVSTTIDRHKNRKGLIKRIPKPDKRPGNRLPTKPQDSKPTKVNKHHVGNLNQLGGNKQKVTNLIRKYLIKMRNGTKNGQEEADDSGKRKKRKQSVPKQNNVNDRTFIGKLFGGDKNVEFQTEHQNMTLPPAAQKFLLSSHSYTAPFEAIKNKTKHIANKFLSLFTIIQFSNFRCQATSTVSQYEGTCYLASECAERHGIAMGLCADGLGVCCVFRGTCGGVSSNNCTYFESPGYPNYFPMDGGVVMPTSTTRNPLTPDPRFPNPSNSDSSQIEQFDNYQNEDYLEAETRQSESANSLSCIFKVYKSSPNVQQMRIDFIDLELAGPTMGNCVNERLEITGMGLTMGIPPICGYNTGQHILVDVSNLAGPLQLAVLANMISRKRYKIRICQYANGCSGLMNCLHSYTGVTGMIQSFNYDQAATLSRSMPGYFNNLNYAICIKREPGYCSITYTNIGPNGIVYPFELRNYEDDGSLSVPAGQAGAGVINCPQDYIVINGIRLCGDRLNDGSINDNFSANAPVTDTSGGPIIIPVRTNPTSTSRGFKLFYTQNRCRTNGGGAGTPDPRS